MTKTELKILFPDGPCTNVCLDFLRFKRGLGQKFEGSDIYRLRDICYRMNQTVAEAPSLSKETALEIAQRRNGESQGTQLNRIRVLRKLAEYMVSMDMDAYIIPRHFTQKYKYDFKPYIFSQEQITAILKVADQVKYSPCSPYSHIVIPAILRLFFGCGLRSSEARLLKVNHVDLDTGILTIEKSKNNVSRYVPMSESLTVYLRKYAVTMGFDMVSDAYFFPSPTSGAYHDTTLRDRFREIWFQAGILDFNNGRFPRIHDMRHSFIVHSYSRLTGELELDLYTALPLIAAYVGHINIKDTERYIHLPEFDYSNIIAAGASVMDTCVPEVIYTALCSDIMSIPEKKTPTVPPKYLTAEEMEVMFSMPNIQTRLGRRDLVLLLLLYDTAARAGELVELKIGDVSFGKTPTVKLFGKGSKTRVVPISRKTADMLQRYIKENQITAMNQFLFQNRSHDKLTTVGVAYILKKYVEMGKILHPDLFRMAISPHLLRSTKASHLIQGRANIYYIRDFLGHSSVVTTERYAKNNPEVVRNAISKASSDLAGDKEYYSDNERSSMLEFLKSLQ